jgi:class 3 adenylate cyclase/tetratricopeptide (TPR) repeat protein
MSQSERAAKQDELLVRAVEAVNRGELKDAHVLAELVLADDGDNLDAGTLLATESQPAGEVRRLTVMFCDLVGSTSLSGRLDPELYRSVLNRYRRLAAEIAVERHGGFVTGFQGDGMLALFGYPTVRGHDTERGVIAALEIAAEVRALSDQIAQMIGEPLAVRAALHRGLLYIDPEQEDVYGLAVNVAARLQGLAEPGEVVVSDEVRLLVLDRFDLEKCAAENVKGLDHPLQPFRVLGRRSSKPLSAVRTPLVGRSAELEQLRGLWQSAVESHGMGVLGVTIVGDAGLGKTRLAETIAGEVAIDGATVVRLAGSSDHRSVGFHPVRRLIESRCRIGAGSSTTDQLLRLQQELGDLAFSPADTVPLLAPILGLDPASGYSVAEVDGRKLSDDIAKAAAEYVLACLGEGAALLVVEDHHNVDDATDDLLDRIMRSGRNQTLVLATSRTSAVAETEQVTLGPISWDACVALVDAIAPSEAPTAFDRGGLVERSDGVPLYLEELVRGSSVEPVDPRQRPTRSAASTVPDVLYEPLMARLYASPATVAVASTASTIGRDVDLDLLMQCVELPAEDVQAAIQVLQEGHILEPAVGLSSVVRFRHELMREVAYDLIAPARRRDVHARVADALIESVEQDERSDWTAIANHFERANRPADAARAWREAADDARRLGLVAEARLRLGSALEQIGQLPAGRDRNQTEVELRLQRGFLASLEEGTSSKAATADYERCLELTLDIPHAPNMVSTLTGMWGYYVSRADLAQARRVSTTLESLVSEEWGAFWRPQNMASFGIIDWLQGDFVRADERLSTAIATLYARDTFDTEAVKAWYLPTHPTVAMHVHLANARFMVGDLVGAEEHGVKAVALAESLPFPQGPWSKAYAQWYLAWMYMEVGDHEQSFARLSEASTIGEQHGYDIWSLIVMTQHAATTAVRDVCAPRAVQTAPGQAILSSLIAAWHEVDMRHVLTSYVTILGRLAAMGGDREIARSRYEESLALAQSTGMHFYDAETLRCQAHLAETSEEVVRQLADALSLARRQGARPFELRIALDLFHIRGESAADELRRAVDGFGADTSYAELDDARARLAQLGR